MLFTELPRQPSSLITIFLGGGFGFRLCFVFIRVRRARRLFGCRTSGFRQLSALPPVMPTTCGFPNCKFRSRYRGQEDNRHFYRIPKRPLVLRQRWLKAIGRTEETVVSQVRRYKPIFDAGEALRFSLVAV